MTTPDPRQSGGFVLVCLCQFRVVWVYSCPWLHGHLCVHMFGFPYVCVYTWMEVCLCVPVDVRVSTDLLFCHAPTVVVHGSWRRRRRR